MFSPERPERCEICRSTIDYELVDTVLNVQKWDEQAALKLKTEGLRREAEDHGYALALSTKDIEEAAREALDQKAADLTRAAEEHVHAQALRTKDLDEAVQSALDRREAGLARDAEDHTHTLSLRAMCLEEAAAGDGPETAGAITPSLTEPTHAPETSSPTPVDAETCGRSTFEPRQGVR